MLSNHLLLLIGECLKLLSKSQTKHLVLYEIISHQYIYIQVFSANLFLHPCQFLSFHLFLETLKFHLNITDSIKLTRSKTCYKEPREAKATHTHTHVRMQSMIRGNQYRILHSLLKRGMATGPGTAATVKKPVVSTANTSSTPYKSATTTSTPKPNTSVKGYTVDLAQKLNGTSKMGIKTLEFDNVNDAITTTASSAVPSHEIDWYNSWYGLGSRPFDEKVQETLQHVLQPKDIEIKPDGLLYLPEIKYRRILNKAFGPGGWGLVPRSETIVTANLVTREYGLICHGQLVGVARGEQDYFNETGIPTATEGCKSNALMRCCKDLGIGSELWDPVFIKSFKEEYCQSKFVEHVTTKKKKKIWLRKDRTVEYPYK